MPCYEPQQTTSDIQAERTAKAIIILDKMMGIETPSKITKIVDAYSFHGSQCNYLTSTLCSKIRALTEEEFEKYIYNARNRDSRFLADWWEEHDKFDKERKQVK